MTRTNTHVDSLAAMDDLSWADSSPSTDLTRLSTGIWIDAGNDDPAGLIAGEPPVGWRGQGSDTGDVADSQPAGSAAGQGAADSASGRGAVTSGGSTGETIGTFPAEVLARDTHGALSIANFQAVDVFRLLSG